MPTFRLGRNVRENIKALRAALGSATRELSRDDLAKLIMDARPKRPLSGSTIRWWEKGRGEPDVQTMRVMADLAGVSYEQFALGTGEPEPDESFDVERDRGLTDAEAARAIQKDASDTRARGRQAKAAGARKRHPPDQEA